MNDKIKFMTENNLKSNAKIFSDSWDQLKGKWPSIIGFILVYYIIKGMIEFIAEFTIQTEPFNQSFIGTIIITLIVTCTGLLFQLGFY